jgi:hypothetical protein
VFSNDWTADFAIDFDKTEPAGRIDLLRDALDRALTVDVDELEICAGAAVGAAAIVAATLPGGPPLGTGGPADFDPSLGIPADLVPLALRAFDRVVGEEPEYAEMWGDPNFRPALRTVRDALAGVAP